jgi:hypothetical protein
VERTPLLDWVEPSPDGEVVALVEAPFLPDTSVVELALAPAGYESAERYRRGKPTWVESAPRPGFVSWSPDSTFVLFWLPEDGPPSAVGVMRDDGKADAVVLDRDQANVVAHLRWPGEATEHHARWLGGEALLYLERTEDASTLWRVDWRAAKARRLLTLAEVE